MESALQAPDAVFVKAEPPEDVCARAKDKPSCAVVSIKTEPSSVSFEIELALEVSVKQEPSETDGTAAAGVYDCHFKNNELVLEPVRGSEPAVERPVATQGQSRKKKSSRKSKKFKCADCEYETANLVSLVSHTKKHCEEKSGHKSTLGVQKIHHTVEAIRCGRIYSTSKSNLPHDVKLHKCNQCSFACTQQDDLLKHKIVHTVKPGKPQKNLQVLEREHTRPKAYKCSYCSESFLEEVSWQVHERKHTGDKPFKCDQCSYAGTQISHLLSHKAMHTSVVLYKCSHCDFACEKKDDFLNHKVIHTNDQPFKCGECSYAADRKWHLQLHQATHTGKKTYKCSTCNFTTLRQITLAKHEARHAVKRYKCEKCSFACNRQFQLKNHERVHDEKLSKRIQEIHNRLSIRKESAEGQPASPLVPQLEVEVEVEVLNTNN